MHGKDPHLLIPILQLREAVTKSGFDPNVQQTSADGFRPYFLIVFGTGDGSTLEKLVKHFKPFHLVIAVADWQDFATSFWTVNWLELSQFQEQQVGGKFSIGKYNDGQSLQYFLSSHNIAGIDHSMIYLPPDGACSEKAKKLKGEINSETLSNSVTYLGYTIDEHNMVWNSWKTLSKSPRVYRKPKNSLGGNMVVCGSGPSLDKNIDNLKKLSRTHLITVVQII